MIPPETRVTKSIRKLQVEWKDSGLWGYLTGQERERCLTDIKALHLLLTQEFRFQVHELGSDVFWHFCRSRDGASIPWFFKKGHRILAIKFHPAETPKAYDWRILKKFVHENPQGLAILIGPEKSTPTILDKNIWFIPLTFVF